MIAISGVQGSFSYAVHTANGQSNSIINISITTKIILDISGAKSAYTTTKAATTGTAIDTRSRDNVVPYVGVDMQGYYTSMPQTRNFTFLIFLPIIMKTACD
ncbi:MAG TPA: hypothetical protein VE619_01385 [Nitrososphaeraceae archaeon]|nr:hypothetical protein [Nitrososphaeraceae archaeon]